MKTFNSWHEGALAILFADTNVGKSILAVQIGDYISRARSPPELKTQAEAQPALYLDFELSGKQFQQRYSVDFQREYCFSNVVKHSDRTTKTIQTRLIERRNRQAA